MKKLYKFKNKIILTFVNSINFIFIIKNSLKKFIYFYFLLFIKVFNIEKISKKSTFDKFNKKIQIKMTNVF